MGTKKPFITGRDKRGRIVRSSRPDAAHKTASPDAAHKTYEDIYAARAQDATPVDQMSPGKKKEFEIISEIIGSRKRTKSSGGRKVVALDIDGVMADFNAALKPHSLAPEDERSPGDYNFVKAGWFRDFDAFENAHVKVMDHAGDIPLNDPTAAEAITTLRNNGFDVIAVTARREEWRDETLRFFAANDIPISSEDLHFMHNRDKTEMHFDYLLDDAPKNVVDVLSNSDAHAVVYSHPYNDHLPIDRVTSMAQFAEMVLADASEG